MKNLFISYKILIRKLYNKRNRRWREAASNLYFILITLNILTLLLISEAIFDFKGIGYLSEKKLPLGPIAAGSFLVLYILFKVLFQKSPNDKKFRAIKLAFTYTTNITKKHIIILLIFCIILFIGSIVINIIR